MCLLAIHMSFSDVSTQIFCPFCDLVVFLKYILSCMSCLYILEINPCWWHHLQIFSPGQ